MLDRKVDSVLFDVAKDNTSLDARAHGRKHGAQPLETVPVDEGRHDHQPLVRGLRQA